MSTDLASALLNASWMNPGAAATPMATSAAAFAPPAPALNFSMPSASSLNFGSVQGSLGYGGGGTPLGVTTTPTGNPGGFMGFLRGQPGVAGDGATGWLSNGQNLGAVFQGLGALTSAYLGFRQLSMAKDQLKFSKESWAKNFANSVQTYNTSLEDRIRGRTASYAGKENDVQSYLARHSLKG